MNAEGNPWSVKDDTEPSLKAGGAKDNNDNARKGEVIMN